MDLQKPNKPPRHSRESGSPAQRLRFAQQSAQLIDCIHKLAEPRMRSASFMLDSRFRGNDEYVGGVNG